MAIFFGIMTVLENLLGFLRNVFLGYSTPICVGIDISSTMVIMVELKRNTLIVEKYAIQSIAKGLVLDGLINDIEQVATIISKQNATLRFGAKHAAIALPHKIVFIKKLDLPTMTNKHELHLFIHEQFQNVLDNEKIDLDYKLISENSKFQKYLVVAAKKERIEEYQAVIQLSGMSLAAIDVEPFAIGHLFEILLQVKPNTRDQQKILFYLDIKQVRAFVFVENKLILFNEINVDYFAYFAGFGDLDQLLTGFEQNNQIDLNVITNAMIEDIVKLHQIIKTNLLAEKKISLHVDFEIFVVGENILIPTVVDKLANIYNKKESVLNFVLS